MAGADHCAALSFGPAALSPTQTPSWAKLHNLAQPGAVPPMPALFVADASRAEHYSLQVGELFLDYSKNRVDGRVFAALLALAEEMDLAGRRDAMFAGDNVNVSESRPALHVALRGGSGVDGGGPGSLGAGIQAQLARVREFSEAVRCGGYLGVTGRPVTDVVNIGIGGSDMGPRMVCSALREYGQPCIRCHFVANVDGAEINRLLERLDPHGTLVIVSSKSFTTHETLLNAGTVLAWLARSLGVPREQALGQFVGITANTAAARQFGIAAGRIFDIWDWVGGRYSLWSAIGLPIAIYVGFEGFAALLAGAREMDRHFVEAPMAANMPVILALLGIWYRNFLGASSQAVVPYCERLGNLVGHLQQLDMESCGKSVSISGEPLDYLTGSVIWGQTGTNGQHSFFQLIHQGTDLIPVDFIAAINDPASDPRHHDALLAHMLAQGAALMHGRSGEQVPASRRHPGNRPSNTLLLSELSPHNLGALIALYEHKVFCQASLWNINPFDQWGVELGKAIAGHLLDGTGAQAPIDPSTHRLRQILRHGRPWQLEG